MWKIKNKKSLKILKLKRNCKKKNEKWKNKNEKYHYGGNFFFYEEKKHKQSSKPGDTFLVADTRLYTLPCRSVGLSVGRSVGHIFEFRAVFVLLLLPNRPRLDCRVSGLVFRSSWVICLIPLTKNTERYAFEKFTQFCLPFTFHSLICASIN